MNPDRCVDAGEDGFTLVELLITVVLIAVVGTISFAFVDQVTATSSTGTRQLASESDAQTVLRTMTQELRGANPISTSTASLPTGTCPTGTAFPTATTAAPGYQNCIRFALVHSRVNANKCVTTEFGTIPAPYEVVTYGLVNGTLYRHEAKFTYVSATAPCTGSVPAGPGRVLLRGLTNAAHAKPLFTYSDAAGAPIGGTQPVAAAGSVRVTLMVPYDTVASDLELTSVASFRNN